MGWPPGGKNDFIAILRLIVGSKVKEEDIEDTKMSWEFSGKKLSARLRSASQVAQRIKEGLQREKNECSRDKARCSLPNRTSFVWQRSKGRYPLAGTKASSSGQTPLLRRVLLYIWLVWHVAVTDEARPWRAIWRLDLGPVFFADVPNLTRIKIMWLLNRLSPTGELTPGMENSAL